MTNARCLLMLCLGLHVSVAAGGVVKTLDGQTIRGIVRPEAGDALVVTPRGKEPVRVMFTNLLRADFVASEVTNSSSPAIRFAPAVLDEHRGALPSPWTSTDIGRMQKRGAVAHYHGTFAAEASPAAKKYKGDALVFIHQPWHGDGVFIARVASVEPRDAKQKQAHAGLMLRTSLEPASPSVSMSLSGGRGSVFRRESRKGEKVIDDARPDLKPPYWVKLVREGGAIAGFQSTDGQHWKLLGSSETDLPEKMLVGLAVSSSRRERAQATLDHVTIRSLAPRSAFAPRVMLRDGTVLADHFASFDESSLILSKANRSIKLRASDVARVLFQPEFEANSLTGGRAGVLMSNGDLIDGEFRGIEAGSVKISSVLLGQRRYELNRKVAAVLLREAAMRPVQFEVITRDGSLWRPERIASGRDSLVLSTVVIGEWRLPAEEVVEIRRGGP